MAEQISKPRGTLDYFGPNLERLRTLVALLDGEARLCGVEPIEVPVFEESRLFKRGVGESTDIVSKETFDLVSKGDRDYTLRPEFTAGINRAVIENKLYAAPDLPLKYFYYGPIFRYERPQVGRYRQFHQWGVEFLDQKIDLASAVSCLALAARQVQKALGVSPLLKINFLGSFSSRERYKEELKNYFVPLVGDMCPDCQRRLGQNPLRILDCKVAADRPLIDSAPLITDFLDPTDRDEYEKIKEALRALELPFVEDPRLVRGLDYYTGLVFELYAADHLELGALGGGGKYGHLMRDLGGPDYEGIGYSFGVDRLLLAARETESLADGIDLFVVIRDESMINVGLQAAASAIEAGFGASFSSFAKGLGGALKMADRKKARHVLILDERGAHFKDMQTREQLELAEFDPAAIPALLKGEK